jgi:hypothetical protein
VRPEVSSHAGTLRLTERESALTGLKMATYWPKQVVPVDICYQT